MRGFFSNGDIYAARNLTERNRKLGTKKVTVGILAHVDAGKTTLAEAILYRTGTLRRLGRVDHQDAFLDTDAMEGPGVLRFFKTGEVCTGRF